MTAELSLNGELLIFELGHKHKRIGYFSPVAMFLSLQQACLRSLVAVPYKIIAVPSSDAKYAQSVKKTLPSHLRSIVQAQGHPFKACYESCISLSPQLLITDEIVVSYQLLQYFNTS